GNVEVEDLLLATELPISRIGVPLVGVGAAHPIPGVVRVAPIAVQVAERGADEDGRPPDGAALALQAVEDFRLPVRHSRELHCRKVTGSAMADNQAGAVGLVKIAEAE